MPGGRGRRLDLDVCANPQDTDAEDADRAPRAARAYSKRSGR